MTRQYGAQRFRSSLPLVPHVKTHTKRLRNGKVTVSITSWGPQEGDFGYQHRVGIVPVGTILYLQDRGSWSEWHGPTLRNPWIVEAWLNREYFPCVPGRPKVTYTTGGHLAQVRSLRNGQRMRVADHIILHAYDAGLTREV